ncbi:hypothetical protein [Gluconobacter kondonii]|uniref:Uncharacterized protein n=1 Tax=Gluconobacter kondonii TaxID=941463 RepID=A0ABQ5WX34_9PROT|nr:hypothetical protein [Gluconobacter kondonii]GBR34965.1 hypothetical protein AA3266_1993 [Gluconobacter kondonii NBRC 3266]GLQ67192.1 hypothetical protein GCM10007870_27770 [Gluconobacter kondonii]
MPASIGLRIYAISVYEESSNPVEKVKYKKNNELVNFVSEFIQGQNTHVADHKTERSWVIEKLNNDPNRIYGYIDYGTFGYESTIKDLRTKTKKYARKSSDVEEIPLFYDFWMPDDRNIFLSLQTFSGKSCVSLTWTVLREWFERTHPGYKLWFQRVIPQDFTDGVLKDSPVKKVTFIKRNTSTDIADLLVNTMPESVDIELTISARRKQKIGILGEVVEKFRHSEGSLITCSGIDFNEADASINIGGKTRKVSIFGINKDAGLIDISEDVDFSPNGHPTLQSLVQQSAEIQRSISHRFIGKKE